MAKRICYTCGNSYRYCPDCDGDRAKPRWLIAWDTEECKDVFSVLSHYDGETVTAKDVKAVLDKYGVSDYSKYKPGIQENIERILKTLKKKKSAEVKEEAEV